VARKLGVHRRIVREAVRGFGAAQEDRTYGGEDGTGGVVDRLELGVRPHGSGRAEPACDCRTKKLKIER
jgi:hypothetical protein